MNNTDSSLYGDGFKHLIKERIKNFWGYGNLDGDTWFVGMEEGYSEENESLEDRFTATAGAQVFDVYESLKIDPGHVFWFEEGAPTQATYRRIIYIHLYLKNGVEPTIEDIRTFQIQELGRSKSNHALLELMPLPSKSIREKDWLYAKFGVEGLSSRKEYLKTYKHERVKGLRDLIKKHKPKVVLFYSLSYFNEWQSVVGEPLDEIIPRKLYTKKNDNTLYAVVPHSVAVGMSKDNWREIALALTPNFFLP
jgi:hypothetical protein